MGSVKFLRIHHWTRPVREALGPGTRAVVWVQGCSLHCKGCMVPETWATSEGQLVDPHELAAQMLLDPEVTGITVSGGEPTEQAAAVTAILSLARQRGKTTWVYSGYTLEELVDKNDPDIDMMLSYVDVLVDGRYDISRAGTYRWRGSSNQRIIHLSNSIPLMLTQAPGNGGIEVTVDGNGTLVIVGVPPPDFLKRFKIAMEARGIRMTNDVHWR